MELHVVSTEGIPEDCVLSVRAGTTRRQAPISADRPFRFPTAPTEAVPFKVDVLGPVANARLILRPGEERRTDCQYTIPLEPAEVEKNGDAKAAENPMSVTIAVQPSDDQGAEGSNAGGTNVDEGTGSRPMSKATSKGKQATSGASASSRHGQASAARDYLDKHNLVEFTQLLVQSVIKEQPERPYAFMAKQFYFPDPEPRLDLPASSPDR